MQNCHYVQQNVDIAVFSPVSGEIQQLRRLFPRSDALSGTIGSA
jgi:hypothetical protein